MSISERCREAFAIEADISLTMGELKHKIEEALDLEHGSTQIWILSEKQMNDVETLKEQCGTHEGLVQVQFSLSNLESNKYKIDIVDVLKPDEVSDADESEEEAKSVTKKSLTGKAGTMRWIICPRFKHFQKVLKIPQDPFLWTITHVSQWLSWAIQQFGLVGIRKREWYMIGQQLFSLSQMEFRKLVPNDPDDIFYMHFELLRKTKVVAVVCDPSSTTPTPSRPATKNKKFLNIPKIKKQEELVQPRVSQHIITSHVNQIQLWQFLLELLTDYNMTHVISWCGPSGEFRLHDPDLVAKLWGERKGKPTMNYEKLSRALRYYYDGEMMEKVGGRKFVYKFIMDLRSIIGYSAEELRQYTNRCAVKEGIRSDM